MSESESARHERVWANISKAKGKARWLGEEPADIEMDKCFGRMKVKKAAGSDRFPGEAFKFGGRKLRKRVYEVVSAEEEREAEDWPEEWKTGIIVPLWKKKGNRANKNN